ncbi:MAG TPA: hypothetical protein VFJ76_03425 [Solirubrobacterales bacterium]|nr:hypothetical protein [Solirubrobacterales bacterium]
MSSAFGKLAAAVCAALFALAVSSASAAEFDRYGLESVGVSLSSPQAGEHADLTTSFALNREAGIPFARTRDIEVHLPPGVIGNPQAIETCSVAQLGNTTEESACPTESQVGVSEISLPELSEEPFAGTFIEPIYNMKPPADSDIVARLGLFAGGYPAFINVRVDPVDYSLVAALEGSPSAVRLLGATTTLWGVPGSPVHDELRLTPQEAVERKLPPGGVEVDQEKPFLSNPTDCSTQREMTITARSYQLPDDPKSKTTTFPQIIGCGKVDFGLEFSALPTNTEAAAPTGIDAELTIPQNEAPAGRATSTLKSAVVTLPEGLTINPSAGDGLGSCSPEQVGYQRPEASHCPDNAKIGSAEIEVPALEHALHGSVYQRTPEPGHLFRFWLVSDELGVHLKLPAEIEANPLTGQLTTVFAGIPSLGGNPQVPVSNLKLHVFGGPRAPLATPSSCGTYSTHYSFTPWSGGPAVVDDTPMQITSGCGKGGFSPGISAGTRSLRAGSFSPLVFDLTRSDGEANPQTLAVHLPQGLLAKLAGVPLCPEGSAGDGSCPASSRVGRLTAAAGVGGAPLWIPQPGKAPTAVYLAGPYRGAPYSVVSVVPAQAGPFDLGTVVNRAGIYIDPDTALATIKTDPLPQILEGVPVSYRTIHVEVDRPDFTLNPTSCEPKKITATVGAANGAKAEPSAPFQATNCAKLDYKPKLKLVFRGSTKRTGNPAIKAVLTQMPHEANTKAAVVLLPSGEFIDNAHISTPCTRVQFNAGNCPKGSILGHAKAVSPLLDEPLQGPVYFRSNGGERELPDIVVDLHGAIHITLVGFIDSAKTGPESSRVRTRFLNVPDAPVSRFTMSLFGGKKGLVENSESLCSRKRRSTIKLKAQNGRALNANQPIQVKCGKRKKGKR